MPGDGPVLGANGNWRAAVVAEARKYLGVPYVWGGTTPAGWDCSGFVQYIFQVAAGVSLPRVAGDQAGVGVNIPTANIQPGDLVFFMNTYAPGISHVGIALGGGQFIHASSVGEGTIISSLGEGVYVAHWAGARRPVADNAATQGGAPNPGVPMPPPGPALAPSQLLPTFGNASKLTGVPQEILLAIARVESGFDQTAIGPYLPQFAGTENEHALGMMQFLPGTYRGVMARVDAATGKNLGMSGIWDAESAIYAAAFYLKDSGAPGDMRRALFAYNNANWYVDLILAWAAHYAGGPVPDPSLYDPAKGGGPPIILVAPENPLQPVQYGKHIDALSPLPLYAPFAAGQTWLAGGAGSFYGGGFHNDAGGAHYAVDFNKVSGEDEGEPVLAVADGIINNVYSTLGGGWTVEMYHRSPQGTLLRSLYLHLKDDPRDTLKLKVNTVVPHGTIIGHVGNTGATSTGAHLHFALYAWQETGWISIRPEPMEGQMLLNGMPITSTNSPVDKFTFEATWGLTDGAVLRGQQQGWLWGPKPFGGPILEQYTGNQHSGRMVQYFDKGRMERQSDGKGGFLFTVGKLGWELLTGKVDLGGGQMTDVGPAQIPLVGMIEVTAAEDAARAAAGLPPIKLAPTYADAQINAARRTENHNGAPIAWIMRQGGAIEPFSPPASTYLVNYDEVTGHHAADVFANWYIQTFQTSPDGDPAHTLEALLKGKVEGFDPGHPLTDPFWVEVTVDGVDRFILVQVFERWTMTYTPDNPDGWQVELGNVGLHYYEWRYEAPARDALQTSPDRSARRRRYLRGEARDAE
jgi:murein DD-endopeptidase MepM/ murein hydrolase activator NlpD